MRNDLGKKFMNTLGSQQKKVVISLKVKYTRLSNILFFSKRVNKL